MSRGKYVGRELRQIRALNVEIRDDRSLYRKVVDAMLPGKASKLQVTQNRTANQGENPKALEKTLVKELGKLVP